MRYAIVADLHANAQAWDAVLTDIGSSRVDRILCLGDVVGYGPAPAKVLASAHRHVHALVLGNHDAVVSGKMSPETFHDRARRTILWTQAQLARSAREFLGALPLTLTAPGFRCAHGSFTNPAAFDYLLEPADAAAAWRAVPEPLLFVGHSHAPGIFVLGRSGVPHALPPQDFALEADKRYIVNVGSVGFPRDGDVRAGYVLFDDATGNVVFRRIPFDLDAFRAAVGAAGLDPELLPSLRRDPRARLTPVREQLDFAPATHREHEAQGVAAVGDLVDVLRRRAARWRGVALVALSLAAAGSAAAFAVARRGQPQPTAIPPLPLEARTTLAPIGPEGSFLPALPARVADDGGVHAWRVIYGDRRAQTVAAGADATGAWLTLRSDTDRYPFRLEAPTLRIADGATRFTLRGEARQQPGYAGHVALVVDLLRTTPEGGEEWVRNYETVEFRQERQGWKLAQRTREFPRATRGIRIAVTGNFRGAVDLRNLRLTRAP